MHKNTHYNILQAPGNGNPLFVVIRGQRNDAGHPIAGATVLTVPIPRQQAIELADEMQLRYESLNALEEVSLDIEQQGAVSVETVEKVRAVLARQRHQ